MCGIVGILDQHQQNTESELKSIANRMADSIAHRGPDSEGSWVDADAGIAFAHRRLAIIDLSVEGNQPMSSSDGRYVIVFNGEIYNFQELRTDLETLGHNFRSNSDTEVLLEAISEWGLENALSRCIGMFAFALWEHRSRNLYLVRDRLGIKPLYYGPIGTSFAFASEIGALWTHPNFQRDIDRDSLAIYMLRNCVPAPYSIYRHIKKLPPGTILTVHGNSGKSTISSYWSLKQVAESGITTPFSGNEGEALEALEDVLYESVRTRLVADVPVGAFLSGGIDSSLVASFIREVSGEEILTYTVGFETADYDETADATAVARHLGTKHTSHTLTISDAMSVIPKLGKIFDEPFADSSQIPTFLVSQIARREVKVVLSGDGGDELFAGYNRHIWCERIASWSSGKPSFLLHAIAEALVLLSPDSWDRILDGLQPVLPSRLKLSHTGDKIHKLSRVLAAQNASEIYRTLVGHWHEPSHVVMGGLEPPSVVSEDSEWAQLPDFTRQMLYLDTRTYLPDDILTKVDRATMAVGLEARVPLLDHRVVEFAWQLPTELKIHNGQGKYILRQALHKRLPKTIFDHPKRGFEVPLHEWLRGPLREWAEDLLSPKRLQHDGYFSSAPIQTMWQEHLSGRRNWHHHLWDVLMFNAWLSEQ